MISKSFFFVFVLSFFVVGFFFLATPEKGFSGINPTTLGCCINNGVNCKGCGTGPCQVPASNCTGNDNVFTADLFCFDAPPPGQNTAVCQGTPPPIGCCQRDQGDCFQTTEPTCDESGFNYLGNGDCLPEFATECTPLPATGCCQTPAINPTSCSVGVTAGDCTNGAFTLGVSCDGDFCGTAPPPIDGCCQTDANNCDDLNNQECAEAGGGFFPGGMCMNMELCELPLEGCCVIEPGECEITTEGSCTDQGGEYQGDNVSCDGIDACEEPPTNVPTIGQWGMIAMAGLLGIFSLLIIMRRHRYNVS